MDINGNTLSEDTDTSNQGETELVINVPFSTEEITLTLEEDTTGKANTQLTIGYTTSQPFLSNSWLVITVPKSNLLYEVTDPANAVSLITATNKIVEKVTFNGSTDVNVNAASVILNVGADYEPDVWAFKFDNGIAFADAGQEIAVNVDIENPNMV